MPKSEFDSPLTVRSGRVAVTGVVDKDTNAAGKAAGVPVVVHWVIEQSGVVAHGRTDADGPTFTDEEASAQAWEPGAAHVSGVTIAVRKDPPGIETFEWDQEVELKLD
jgi:hypothetical protein